MHECLLCERDMKKSKNELAAELLQYSLEKNPKDFIITDEKIIENIKTDQNFIDKINEIISKYGRNNEFNISIEDKESMTFENSDLYFAIHIAKIEMKAKKENDFTWNADIILRDTFDFAKWKRETNMGDFMEMEKLL